MGEVRVAGSLGWSGAGIARGTRTSGIRAVVCSLGGWLHVHVHLVKIHPAVDFCALLNICKVFIEGLLKTHVQYSEEEGQEEGWGIQRRRFSSGLSDLGRATLRCGAVLCVAGGLGASLASSP